MALLPKAIGYGRLDTLLHLLVTLETSKTLKLDWRQVERISPAGFAMLACLFDSAVEHACELEHVFVGKKLKGLPIVQNLLQNARYRSLPKPSLHNQDLPGILLSGNENTLDIGFPDRLETKFASLLSDDLAFSCRLVLNELMQNSVDHSTGERYYLYAGTWQKNGRQAKGCRPSEFHVGVLDMGVTIPAKLEQKYTAQGDLAFLDLALEEGTTTRRMRPGGLGLHHTFEHLKDHEGTLTILSRDAQLIRYFKNKKILRSRLKHRLRGTWCLARFPL